MMSSAETYILPPETPEPQDHPSRRQLLAAATKGAVGALTLCTMPALLNADRGPATTSVEEMNRFLAPYTDTSRTAENLHPTYPRLDKTIVLENLETRVLPASSVAFATVHTGFIGAQLSEIRMDFASSDPRLRMDTRDVNDTRLLATGELGDIAAHQARCARLLSALGSTGRTVMSFVEEPDMYNPQIPRDDLTPPDNAFQIATEPASGKLASNVTYQNKDAVYRNRQRPDLLFKALRKAGVTTVLFAGEYTFNPWYQGSACLGGVAKSFMNAGFEARGIANAVFPPRPQEGIDRQSKLAHAMYDNAIPFNEAIAIAKASKS